VGDRVEGSFEDEALWFLPQPGPQFALASLEATLSFADRDRHAPRTQCGCRIPFVHPQD
jgi:hypothetical protein